MKTRERILFSFYGAALLILSVTMVIMQLVSGDPIDLQDSYQLKLAAEIFILVLTAVALLSRKRKYIFGRRAMIVLLLLTGSVLTDIFVELRNGDAENLIVILIMLVILLILNVWSLIVVIRNQAYENIRQGK